MRERTAAEIGPLRQRVRGRLMERTGLTMDGWARVRHGKKRGYLNKLLRRYLGAAEYPGPGTQARRIIKALETDADMEICGEGR